ncbi:unnamed protein product [Albugo candida]|uniref:Uncharacterized protein n=1 Tax=Albugo candida TaxID=65357 RepID=A0A024G0L8_9STRA|nr:unnamed protein product [Albugo candida]|eukprot:CCI40108.1 unnamed protein product [Albugo candida]
MAAKVVLFTEFANPVSKNKNRRFKDKSEINEMSEQTHDNEPTYTHVFSGVQNFAERQMDRFFRVEELREKKEAKEKESVRNVNGSWPHNN